MTEPAFNDDRPANLSAKDRDPPVRLLAILIVGAIVIVLVWLIKQQGGFASKEDPGLGTELERVALAPLVGEGGAISSADLEGKVTLINFWGTWCQPCMIEFPHLVAMNERLSKHSDFQFVPVACAPDVGQEFGDRLRTETEDYLKRSKYSVLVYSDPGGTTRRSVLNRVGGQTFYFPTSVLLDRQGVIRGLWPHYKEGLEEEMEAQINELLRS
jgi:thiol-disulfide isomerase/thioredoxin